MSPVKQARYSALSDDPVGPSTAAELLLQELWDEIGFNGAIEITELQVYEVVDRVSTWEETGNPFFIERAFELAVKFGLSITATLAIEMVEAIRLRRVGYKGSWGQVRRWEWKPRAYLLICHMVYHKVSLEDAASRASYWMAKRTSGDISIKASTLQKDYSLEWRRSGIERDYHEHWRIVKTPEDEAEVRQFMSEQKRSPWMDGTRR
jgi:hypothetical protein